MNVNIVKYMQLNYLESSINIKFQISCQLIYNYNINCQSTNLWISKN